jgi:hypothetical protein
MRTTMNAAENGKFFMASANHGADHRRAEQSIDFLLQAFFTMLSIKSRRADAPSVPSANFAGERGSLR